MSFPASKFLMVRPAAFGSNPETLGNNKFQQSAADNPKEIIVQAIREFDSMVEKLRSNSINVSVLHEPENSESPDSVFPNNWFSTHSNCLCLYPMYSRLRRGERREVFIDEIENLGSYSKCIDLSVYEDQGIFLEGTGSLVFDHDKGKVYCAKSPRSDKTLFELISRKLKHVPVYFEAFDDSGFPIYHTNVLMAMGKNLCVLCENALEKVSGEKLVQSLERDGKKIIEISIQQMEHFAGNMLYVSALDGKKYWLMSDTAFNSLDESQLNLLKEEGAILQFSIPTIEKYGGGSVRCMIAELY